MNLLEQLAKAFVYEANTDAGGGGGTPPAPSLPAPAQQGLQNLINRQGGTDAAVVLLYQENHQYRERIRQLEKEVEKTKGQLPKEGEVVLSGKDLEAWKAYQALGDPETVKKLQGELNDTKAALGALQKEQVLRDVAEVSGYKFQVLRNLGAELDYEIREVEQDGKKAKGVFVKNGDGQTKPLADYAQEKWTDFLPALKPAETQAPPQPAGTRFPTQNPGSPAPQKNLVDDFISETQAARKNKVNPLVKQQ